jgi:hypothetical protein
LRFLTKEALLKNGTNPLKGPYESSEFVLVIAKETLHESTVRLSESMHVKTYMLDDI